MAVPTTIDPLRDALDAIMDWPDEGEIPIAGGGLVAPREDVVNLATTAELENVVPPAVEDPFAAELAALQASNAELSAQLAGGGSSTASINAAAAAHSAALANQAAQQPMVLYAAPKPVYPQFTVINPDSKGRPQPQQVLSPFDTHDTSGNPIWRPV